MAGVEFVWLLYSEGREGGEPQGEDSGFLPPWEGGPGERVFRERFSRPWQEHLPGPGIGFQGSREGKEKESLPRFPLLGIGLLTRI